MVAAFASKAAYGSISVAHWLELAVMSEADEDAITFLMPVYLATVRYLLQSASV